MGSKKVGVFAGILILIVLFVGFASAETCEIKLRTTCDSESGYAILGLSGSTNAHGQLWNATTEYNYVLCCDFERTKSCDGTNKIIGLSDVTNAHAEIPSLDNYNIDICYGNFVCTSPASCSDNEMGILSLTDDTNAHIGNFGDYDTKICCAGICGVGEEYIGGQCKKTLEIYWANMNWVKIETINVIPGTTTVRMVVKNSELPAGPINFEIYENDFLFDDEIRVGDNAIIGTVDANGNANASWTITQEDLDNGLGGTDDTYSDLEFYFELDGIKNPEYLTITTVIECDLISLCMDYSNEEECQADGCEVAANSTPEEVICGGDTICECSWNSDLGECGPSWETISGIECGYCGDGYVRLDWEECEDGNHGNDDSCSAGCLNNTPDGLGGWYYCGDGERNQAWEECDDGGNINNDGCSSQCLNETLSGSIWLYCGDTILNQVWEECDEGNSGWDPDICSPTCKNSSELLCDEIPPAIGTCSYTENTTDDCEDGFLTYSWEGVWTWDSENNFTSDLGDDYILGYDGYYHYDPQRISEDCVGGDRIITCSAQIQLPFSNIYSVIAALILIALIYGFLIFKKKKRKGK